MANTASLKSWKKGQSGNPKGRPKLPSLKKAIAKILDEKIVDKNGVPHKGIDIILRQLLIQATKGNVRAAQELLDRGYGKAVQYIEADVNQTIISAVSAPAPGVVPGEATGEEGDEPDEE